jgi:hypothetical protein
MSDDGDVMTRSYVRELENVCVLAVADSARSSAHTPYGGLPIRSGSCCNIEVMVWGQQ